MGKRGELYVVLQFLLLGIVFFGPVGPVVLPPVLRWVALPLLITGIPFLFAGAFFLGKNLTPLPHPKEGSKLVKRGPYALVRHPIYTGSIFLGFAWFFRTGGLFTFFYAVIFALFFDIKSGREEEWLEQRYWNYDLYRQKVKKLIPFIY